MNLQDLGFNTYFAGETEFPYYWEIQDGNWLIDTIGLVHKSNKQEDILAAIKTWQEINPNPEALKYIGRNGSVVNTFEARLAGLDLAKTEVKLIHTGYRPTITSMQNEY